MLHLPCSGLQGWCLRVSDEPLEPSVSIWCSHLPSFAFSWRIFLLLWDVSGLFWFSLSSFLLLACDRWSYYLFHWCIFSVIWVNSNSSFPTSLYPSSSSWSSSTPKYVWPLSWCSWLKPLAQYCAPVTSLCFNFPSLPLHYVSVFCLHSHTLLLLKSNPLLALLSFSLSNVLKVERNHWHPLASSQLFLFKLYRVPPSCFSYSTPPKVTANFSDNHLLLQHFLFTALISNHFDQSPHLPLPH